MKVAINFIGTNKYKDFFDGYYEGLQKNFLPNIEKHYFVYTDDTNYKPFDKKNVTSMKIDHQGWPYITLYRFKFINQMRDQISKFDYTFFIDADLWCVGKVSWDEIIGSQPLIGVQHPGFVGKIGAFETDSRSRANIYDGEYDLSQYRQGCFWGGKTNDFLEMTNVLEQRVDADLEDEIVAVWHDESHTNKYFLENKSLVRTLHPGYAQPQNGYKNIREEYPTKFVHLHKDLNEFPRFAGVR
jgi:hypothetical protein|tara:strand:+ start:23 stop:748 length:726 start_codon:yes stop_codon:yes gene_type:complete